jgi:predicted alpha/beta superfamily hydrolase
VRIFRLFLPVLVLCWTCCVVHAADKATPLTFGESFTIVSQALGETRRINVYVAPAYGEKPGAARPVLYMPDGGMAEDFLHVAGLLQVSVGNGTVRPMILVGIENTQCRRDLTGPTSVASDRAIAPVVGGSAAFRDFLRKELLPQIRARYRTSGETAIIGESLAGLFVVETYLHEPALFDTYIAFDPSLWWSGRTLLGDAGRLLRTPARPPRRLYFASSGEPGMAPLTEALAGALGAAGSGAWHYQAMPAESHATIYHPAAMQALRALFKP